MNYFLRVQYYTNRIEFFADAFRGYFDMPWRPHLPENCPPEDAEPTNGIFYRLIEGNEPKAEDFLSHRELGKPKPDRMPECEFCGVSVFSELAGVISLLNLYPRIKTKKHLAKVQLTSEHGKIKNTPSKTHDSHHSWWIPDGVDPSEVSAVINFPEAGE